jgi:adenylate kinase family enzyme
MDAGDFVPDSVTNSMVRARLAEEDVQDGFLLDGYPRTAAQVTELDDILRENDSTLDVVLQLTADDEELVRRLLGRARLDGRTDDNEVVIRHRLDLYHEQTEAVVSACSAHATKIAAAKVIASARCLGCFSVLVIPILLECGACRSDRRRVWTRPSHL